MVNYFAFNSKDAALEFERYLKTGSGYAIDPYTHPQKHIQIMN